MFHVLRNDVNGSVLAADAIKLHQILMLELRHHFCFFNEIVFGHCADLHHLDGCVDGSTPLSTTHDSKLARTEFLENHQFRWVDFPFVYEMRFLDYLKNYLNPLKITM